MWSGRQGCEGGGVGVVWSGRQGPTRRSGGAVPDVVELVQAQRLVLGPQALLLQVQLAEPLVLLVAR